MAEVVDAGIAATGKGADSGGPAELGEDLGTRREASRLPRTLTKNAGVRAAGHSWSRRRPQARRAWLAVGCSGTSRALASLPALMVTTPVPVSTSPRSRPQASPTRIPVTASSAMSVV
jgi:hypothetical protein